MRRRAILGVAMLLVTGCGATGGTGAADPAEGPRVVAGFYPVEFATARILGDRGMVQNVTPPGAEPHDLELTPRGVAAVAEADLVVYLAGFQPALDDAVASQAPNRGLDVSPAARLTPTAGEPADGTRRDPHFWLDPTRLADVADAVAEHLAELSPDDANTFRANAAALRTDLTTLDEEFRSGLAECASRIVVTSHEAFGYLAERYDLTQVGIAGLSPDAEPDARALAELTDFIRTNDVRTVYYETLVSPDVATTLADGAGVRTAVLDPLEGLADPDSAADYISTMRANLSTLRGGQACS